MADILPPGPVSVRAASELCTKLISTRALIFIDEFDRSESPEFRRNIAEFLKNLSDRQCRVQLVLAGVAANLTEILTEIPSIRRNIFALDVPKMTSDEIRQLIRTGETASGLKYEDKAVETIVAVANGLPYLASLLGQYVGLSALNEGRTNVTYADVQVAIEDVLSELNAQMSVASRTHLRALKRANGHLVLGRLAGHATMSHGAFDLEAVDAIFPEKDNAALCRRILADMATDRSLIETFEDDTGQHYRFVDANVPQYLWLLAEQGRLAGEGTKAAPQTQSA
jgi:CheY-like chemotaxis protein